MFSLDKMMKNSDDCRICQYMLGILVAPLPLLLAWGALISI